MGARLLPSLLLRFYTSFIGCEKGFYHIFQVAIDIYSCHPRTVLQNNTRQHQLYKPPVSDSGSLPTHLPPRDLHPSKIVPVRTITREIFAQRS